MSAPPVLVVSRCVSCHGRFLPRKGNCPRCGSAEVEPHEVLARGEVLAATELALAPPGWPSPHRIAFVEAPEGVRLFAVVPGALPAVVAGVSLSRDGDHYVVLPVPEPRR